MLKLLVFLILLLACWPLALAALILYPILWLALIPFRIAGLVVVGTFELIAAVLFLPVRILRAV